MILCDKDISKFDSFSIKSIILKFFIQKLSEGPFLMQTGVFIHHDCNNASSFEKKLSLTRKSDKKVRHLVGIK